ncbi:hypothetical protein J6590_016925 [Homalodisca vitripennis]|nr:hypothetical protein J6590_016925 [Homalodisca vitripennis]
MIVRAICHSDPLFRVLLHNPPDRCLRCAAQFPNTIDEWSRLSALSELHCDDVCAPTTRRGGVQDHVVPRTDSEVLEPRPQQTDRAVAKHFFTRGSAMWLLNPPTPRARARYHGATDQPRHAARSTYVGRFKFVPLLLVLEEVARNAAGRHGWSGFLAFTLRKEFMNYDLTPSVLDLAHLVPFCDHTARLQSNNFGCIVLLSALGRVHPLSSTTMAMLSYREWLATVDSRQSFQKFHFSKMPCSLIVPVENSICNYSAMKTRCRMPLGGEGRRFCSWIIKWLPRRNGDASAEVARFPRNNGPSAASHRGPLIHGSYHWPAGERLYLGDRALWIGRP